ncbi:MAG: hypothetical protein GY936_09350 [Ignavibacteriae bacterium]|nr:hypothetical protein [Ignavibacteriota bacterium]
MRNIKYLLLSILFISLLSGCIKEVKKTTDNSVKYNLIEPGNGIYAIVEKDVSKDRLENNFYEKVYFDEKLLIKIERYNKSSELTDELSVAAITAFEYNSDKKVKQVKYFNSMNQKFVDEDFGYHSIEYIYDEVGRVRMEIYRNANSEFLKVPRDDSGNIAKVDFLSPVLTYEYVEDKLRIKALDQNFNLLKEVVGDKPCVPFIDCGENE